MAESLLDLATRRERDLREKHKKDMEDLHKKYYRKSLAMLVEFIGCLIAIALIVVALLIWNNYVIIGALFTVIIIFQAHIYKTYLDARAKIKRSHKKFQAKSSIIDRH